MYVRAQQMGVAHAARVAGAVEEFENLDGALAAQTSCVAEGAGFHFPPGVAAGDVGNQGRELIHARRCIEQILDDLEQLALARKLLEQLAH